MTQFKSLTTWTLVSNCLIIVGAGHGIGCLGLIEILWATEFYGIGTEDFSLSLMVSYDKSLGAVAIFSLVGQLLLIFSLLVKTNNKIFLIQQIGLVFLWIGFFYLLHHVFDDTASQIGFVTGIPFLLFSGFLFYKIRRQKRESASI